MVLNPINRIIWAIAIFFFIYNGIFFLKRAYSKDASYEEREFQSGIGSLFLGIAALRVCFFLSDFFLVLECKDGFFCYGDYDVYQPLYPYFGIVGMIFVLISVVVFLIKVEHVIDYKPLLYATIATILIPLIITGFFMTNFETQRIALYIIGVIGVILVFFSLTVIGLNYFSESPIRDFFTFLGCVSIVIGLFLDARFIKETEIIPPYFPALILIFGCINIILPEHDIIHKWSFFSKLKEKFKNHFWKLFFGSNSLVIFIAGMIFVLFNIPLHYLLIYWIGLILLVIFFGYFVINLKKRKVYSEFYDFYTHISNNFHPSKYVDDFVGLILQKESKLALKTLYALYICQKQNEEKDCFSSSDIKLNIPQFYTLKGKNYLFSKTTQRLRDLNLISICGQRLYKLTESGKYFVIHLVNSKKNILSLSDKNLNFIKEISANDYNKSPSKDNSKNIYFSNPSHKELVSNLYKILKRDFYSYVNQMENKCSYSTNVLSIIYDLQVEDGQIIKEYVATKELYSEYKKRYNQTLGSQNLSRANEIILEEKPLIQRIKKGKYALTTYGLLFMELYHQHDVFGQLELQDVKEFLNLLNKLFEILKDSPLR